MDVQHLFGEKLSCPSHALAPLWSLLGDATMSAAADCLSLSWVWVFQSRPPAWSPPDPRGLLPQFAGEG